MRKLVIAALLVLPVLAGCSSDSKATPTGMSTPSQTQAPTPTVEPAPSPPEGIYDNSNDGAIAFTRFFFEVVNHAYRTGEASDLRNYSAKTCKTCAKYINSAEDSFANGSTAEGGQVTITSVEVPGQGSGNTVDIVVTLDATPFVLRDRRGKVTLQSDGATARDYLVRVVRQQDRWLTGEVQSL